MQKKRYFGLQRNVFYTGLTSLFTDISVKMVYSVMPLFLLSIGASKTTLSLIEGIAESTAALLKGLSGFWSDKIGRNKPFMIIGYAATAVITPLYAGVARPVHVLYLRFAERLGKGLRTAPRDSLIAGSVDKSEIGKSFGFHKAMDNSGAIIGPLLAMLILWIWPKNFSLIFILATIPAILGVINIIFMVNESKKKTDAPLKFNFKALPKRFYFFLVIMFVFSLGNSTDALLLVRTKETGVSDQLIPLVYLIFNSVSVLLAIPAGKLSDKIGREKLLIAGFLVYGLVYFCFGWFNNLIVFIGLFMIYGIYSSLTDSSQKAMVADLVDPQLKGTGFGIYHTVLGITLLPASIIAGILYDKVGPSVPFYFGAVMAFLSTLLLLVFILTQKRKRI